MSTSKNTVLNIKNLHVNFRVHAGVVQAIRGVDIRIKEGEIVCLVGESGSGKSVTAKSVMGLLPTVSTSIPKGHIILNGIDTVNFTEEEFSLIRGGEAAMIFQDPMTALNPVMTVGQQINEALLLHHVAPIEEYDSEDAKAYYTETIELEKNARLEFSNERKRIKSLKLDEAEADKLFNENIEKFNEVIVEIKERKDNLRENVSKEYFQNRAIEMLKLVGIHNAEAMYNQYPHQLSGGMRQRIVIAIALSCEPKLLIADEPTTALDVTIQAQILELIKKLQKELNFAVLFITHDLGVVANMADHIYVMYAGKIVEKGTNEEIFYNPLHPYTWGLLSSMPDLETSKEKKLYSIPGTPPNLLDPPKGDAFAARNQFALKIDFEEEPPMFQVTKTHAAATWLLDERAPKVERPAIIGERIERYKKLTGGLND